MKCPHCSCDDYLVTALTRDAVFCRACCKVMTGAECVVAKSGTELRHRAGYPFASIDRSIDTFWKTGLQTPQKPLTAEAFNGIYERIRRAEERFAEECLKHFLAIFEPGPPNPHMCDEANCDIAHVVTVPCEDAVRKGDLIYVEDEAGKGWYSGVHELPVYKGPLSEESQKDMDRLQRGIDPNPVYYYAGNLSCESPQFRARLEKCAEPEDPNHQFCGVEVLPTAPPTEKDEPVSRNRPHGDPCCACKPCKRWDYVNKVT